MSTRRVPDERGAAGSVLVIGMALATACVFCVSMVLIHWFAVARQAEQAAELAALAGAGAAAQGEDPCQAARDAAERNGSSMAECDVRGEGRYAVIEVSVRALIEPRVLGAPQEVTRSATAATY